MAGCEAHSHRPWSWRFISPLWSTITPVESGRVPTQYRVHLLVTQAVPNFAISWLSPAITTTDILDIGPVLAEPRSCGLSVSTQANGIKSQGNGNKDNILSAAKAVGCGSKRACATATSGSCVYNGEQAQSAKMQTRYVIVIPPMVAPPLRLADLLPGPVGDMNHRARRGSST